MSGAANVTSIDAVKRFRTAALQFESGARDAMTQLLLECRRAAEWIEVDRPRYWKQQTRRAYNEVAEARVNLDRCRLSIGSDDQRSCYDEKKAFDAARQRQRYAEQMQQVVQGWQQKIRHEVEEFETQLAKTTNRFDTDLPRAAAALQRMIAALEKYAARGTIAEPEAIWSRAIADLNSVSDNAGERPGGAPTEGTSHENV